MKQSRLVHAIYTRKWRREHRDAVNRYARNWRRANKDKATKYSINSRRKYPDKCKSRYAVAAALKAGKLFRPSFCSGCLKKCKPQAHHHDYQKPLKVVWLCSRCHREQHPILKEWSMNMSFNEAFAARRAELVAARREHFHGNNQERDFAPSNGFCMHWNIHLPGEPRCGFDLVAHFGEEYPTAFITGCPECGSSFCD